VLAAGLQLNQNHQIRAREKPSACLFACCSGLSQETQVLALGKGTQVIGTNPGEARDLSFSEYLLARPNFYAHRFSLCSSTRPAISISLETTRYHEQ
jgi:hypothetical protein